MLKFNAEWLLLKFNVKGIGGDLTPSLGGDRNKIPQTKISQCLF